MVTDYKDKETMEEEGGPVETYIVRLKVNEKEIYKNTDIENVEEAKKKFLEEKIGDKEEAMDFIAENLEITHRITHKD